MVTPLADAPRVAIASRAALREWLEANHDRSAGVWIVTDKKGSPDYLSYDAIVEELLCFGWIDSLPRALDDRRSMRYVAPRKPGGAWSKVNKARISTLIANGRMAPPGLARIEAARKDGSWEFLDDVDDLIAPDDLIAALEGYPNARSHYEAFPPSWKKIILEWIKTAKRPETRRKRIAETAEQAERNLRAHHYRR